MDVHVIAGVTAGTGGVVATPSAGTGLTKGARITGADRQTLGAQLAERYRAGESIRALAAETGRSFGFVHGVIKESGVTLRGRGGATRRSSPVAATATVETPVSQAHPPVEAGKKSVGKKATKKDPAKKDGSRKSGAKKGEAKAAGGKKKGKS